MFDLEGAVSGYEAVKESTCRPDYESMAARLHKKIEANQTCLEGLRAGLEAGSLRDLGREDSKLIFAIIGNLTLPARQDSKEYAQLLEEIEKKG